ncbi:MAG: rane integrity-associated transporter subunit PqiC [Proteobacteria bacterium]|nr:rane integrity-associated transporter subunit PqiC [Pseudomonadota bacterium]
MGEPFPPFAAELGMVACASTQIHYHRLMPTELNAVPNVVAPAPAAFSFEVLPIGIPAQVDRQEMVVREDKALLILEGKRWAAPPGRRNARSTQRAAAAQARGAGREWSGIRKPAPGSARESDGAAV